MKTIAVHSSKGGVGKTSAAVNLAHLSSRDSLRTLLVDLDPQGSASFIFRMASTDDFGGKDLIKGNRKIESGVRASDYEALDLIPAALSFRKFDAILSAQSAKKAKVALRKALSTFEEHYDLLVLDCPPGMSALAEAIYEAADLVLCPIIPTPLSVMSLGRLWDFLEKRGIDADKLHIFLSMVEPRKSLQAQTAEALEKTEESLLKARIPFSSEIERMSIRREPLSVSGGKSKAAVAFLELWLESKDILFKI